MEKKYQIFISSTYRDLKTARLKVRDAILAMYHFPVGMEMFGALDEDQWKVIRRDIDASDYYVLIIGKMFGSEVPGEEISYTQKEYRYAVEKGIPVLAFLMRDDVEVAKTFQETEKDRVDKLNAFRREVETGRTVSHWSNPDELAGKVSSSLGRQIARKQRPGWIRASEFDIEKSHAEILELTEKVRELESENAVLRKITGERRKPKLKIELFQPIKLEISNPKPVPDYLLKAAEEGENSAEAAEIVEAYKLRSYIKAGREWFDLVIRNEGTCKATDITVEIDVPDGLKIFEISDLGMYTDLIIPESITGNRHPIRLRGIKEERGELPDELYSYGDIDGWDVDEKHVKIEVNEIRHLGGKRCVDFLVTASEPGIYKQKCTLMCSEYVAPEFQELEVEVVKTGV